MIGRGTGTWEMDGRISQWTLEEVKGGGAFSLPLLVCGDAVRLMFSGALWWTKESSILEVDRSLQNPFLTSHFVQSFMFCSIYPEMAFKDEETDLQRRRQPHVAPVTLPGAPLNVTHRPV